MKKIILIIIVVGLIISAIIFYILRDNITGRVVEENIQSHTQAICNKTENGKIYCEDYEIVCKSGEVGSKTPTGFSIYHADDWEDPRGENGSEISC